ncbi:hypothetical protein [Fodinibius saliphilus]|uniref:hypothetical protein n=1 Tax=Fodinibius saliphilus TaxID=1920650 RepID=UPI001109A9BD|nr:hypothetical protein [Fodinibius saliphilus]
MKRYLALTFIVIVFSLATISNVEAQRLELLGGNTLNGAMNGVVLGGATMALKNSDDFKPVKIGLGAGTLYGIGVGIYDISQINAGQQFYISGTFNDGVNSSIIVLLDTFYGAAAGAIISSSVSLIIQEPIVDALQYGSGIGAWAGFGFGVFDAFVLSEGPNYSQQANQSQTKVDGLLTYSNASKSVNIGMFNPTLIKQKKITKKAVQLDYRTAVDLIQLKIGF